MFVSYDSPETAFLREVIEEVPPYMEVHIEQLFEGKEQQAYEYSIGWIRSLRFEDEGFRRLQKSLCKRFGLSMRRAVTILQHAKVTLRMALSDQVRGKSLEEIRHELPPSCMFRRMLPYLEEGKIREACVVFGGVEMKVPKGVY